MLSGGDPVVQSTRGPARHHLRHPCRHLVLRLHLRRAVQEVPAVPRQVRDGPAGQDLPGGGHSARDSLAGGLPRPQEQLCKQSAKKPSRSRPGNRSVSSGSPRGIFSMAE